MGEFVDYYSILQVHHLAEPDVIENTYKKLCKKYHPDVNHTPDAHRRMQEINDAYRVLKDAQARAAYTREWTIKTSVQQRMPFVAQVEIGPKDIIKQYFLALANTLYEDAYGLLSEPDQRNVTKFSFMEWQKNVAEIYKIEQFDVRLSRKYNDFLIEDNLSVEAQRFTINICERNKLNGKTSRYAFTKFLIHQNGKWRVYLGYRDLAYIANHFKFIAGTREEAAVLGEWEHYKKTMDVGKGLPNREGFKERATPEIYRYERYHRDFTISVMQLRARRAGVGDALQEKMLTHAAYTLRKLLRAIDILAFAGDDMFTILLAETNEPSAQQVLARLAKRVQRDIWACFDVQIGIRTATEPFCGGSIDCMIDDCTRKLHKAK